MACTRWSLVPLVMVAATAATLLGQGLGTPVSREAGFLMSRVDGKQWRVQWIGVRGQADALELQVQHLAQTRWVAAREVLELNGPTPRVSAEAAVYLVGGGEVKGKITGGDKDGYALEVATAAMGKVTVQVDRVRRIVFRANVPLSGDVFVLPEGAKEDEAVFKVARRGFDRILGALERFTEEGILFHAAGTDAPQLFRYRELAGFALRGGVQPKEPGPVQLITTAGDVLRVQLQEVRENRLWVSAEGARLQVPLASIAAVSFLSGDGRQYLSELPVVREEERASADELGTQPLFPYRRDRTASGGFVGSHRHSADGFLTVHGHTYAKGLGVHSRSKLTFRVPPGCKRFHGLVGIDDEVLATSVRGNADVRVRMGDKVLFTALGLRRGQAPRSLGVLAVEPGALLTLEVDFGKGMFLGDRVDWLMPVFLP